MLAPPPQSKILAPAHGGFLRFISACLLIAALWALPNGDATYAIYGGALGALALRGFAISLTGKGGGGAAFATGFGAGFRS